MQYKLSLVICAFLILISTSCQDQSNLSELPAIDQNEIIGLWTMVEAKRNGRSTESLIDAYFHFHGIDKMSTNVFGDISTQEVIWSDSILTVSDSTMRYKIKRLQEDTLAFNFEIQRYVFDLIMIRSPENDSISVYAPSDNAESL